MADLALICTKDDMHYEPAMKAIELGYDILLEKPVDISVSRAAALNAVAEAAGKVSSITFNQRTNALFSAAVS